jgi:hypothetical protein
MAKSYNPNIDPNYDPNANYGSPNNPIENTNFPQWQQNPYQTNAWDWMNQNIGGPAGWQNTVSQVQSLAQPGQTMMSQMPWNTGQIGSWLTNQMSGKGAATRANAWKTGAMSDVNRTFSKGYDALRGNLAGRGLKGSSGEAALKARGLGEYDAARNSVSMGAQTYEDQLKQQMFGQGMQGLNAWNTINQGDVNNRMNSAGMLLSSLQPGMNVWQGGMGAQGTIGGQAGEQGIAENQFDLNAWLQTLKHNPNGWAVLGQIAPMLLQGMMPGLGGAGAAAAA